MAEFVVLDPGQVLGSAAPGHVLVPLSDPVVRGFRRLLIQGLDDAVSRRMAGVLEACLGRAGQELSPDLVLAARGGDVAVLEATPDFFGELQRFTQTGALTDAMFDLQRALARHNTETGVTTPTPSRINSDLPQPWDANAVLGVSPVLNPGNAEPVGRTQ